MAFWGVQVIPGKPVTHSYEKGRRRLRISQATLGFGEASQKTVVQCNVGNRSPIFLFELQPNKRDSCRLDLEFEETEDVVFSVIGPRSVHLTGYYVQRGHRSDLHSDIESYGMDIENTQTDGSTHQSDDDLFEDSFINDDEIKVSSQSPVLSSKGQGDFSLENNEPKERKGHGKQHKKKNQVIESDIDINSHESSDEHISLSKFMSDRAVTSRDDAGEKTAQATEKMDEEAKYDAVHGSESKQKVDPLDINGKQEGEKKLSLDEERTEVNQESNEHPEDMEDLAKIIMSIQDGIQRNNTKDSNIIHNLPVNDGRDQLQSLDLGFFRATPEKKRKECSVKKNETCEVQTNKEDNNVPGEDKEYEIEASMENGVNYLANPPELGSIYVPKSKKRRNGIQMEGSLAEGFDEHQNIPQESVLEQGFLCTDSMTKNLEASIGEYEDQQRFREACAEDIGAKTHYIPAEDEVILESHAEITKEDLIAAAPANGENQELIDNSISVKYEIPAKWKRNAMKFMQRKKKIQLMPRKKKIRISNCLNLMEMTGNEETTPAKYKGQSTETATGNMVLSNGLVVEELSSGPEKGKVATHGKLVKLHYTASLKENGHVFESTVGKPAFSFRLGDEEIIDGWNAGIEGMRVGDKRRLIIPPSMGFGDHAMDNVPPNSWLVYYIELVCCRR